MKICGFVLVLTATCLSSSFSLAGPRGPGGSGGGDTVYCDPVVLQGLKLNGYYSMDFVSQLTSESAEDLAFLTSSQALDGIERKLIEVVPSLGERFSEFRRLYKSRSLSEARVWRGGVLPLVNIPDEHLTRVLPKECSRRVYQAVVRTTLGDDPTSRVIYDYDSTAIKQIETQPLQLSFLLVHEWLRDFTESAIEIRTINWYLHSHQFMNGTEDQVFKVLLGFQIDGHGVSLRRGSVVRAELNAFNDFVLRIESGLKDLCSMDEPEIGRAYRTMVMRDFHLPGVLVGNTKLLSRATGTLQHGLDVGAGLNRSVERAKQLIPCP